MGLMACLGAFAQQAKLIPIDETEDYEVLIANQVLKTDDGTYVVILKTYLYTPLAQGSFMEQFEVNDVPAYKMEWVEFSPDWSKYAIYSISASDDYGNMIFKYDNPKPRTFHPISSSQTIYNIVPMAKKFQVIPFPK